MIRRIIEAIDEKQFTPRGDVTEPDDVTKLAREFAAIIRYWLTPTELAKVNADNRAAGYSSSTCATHDYCDANQAMIDAMEKLGIEWIFAPEDDDPEFDAKLAAKDEQGQLMDAAWDMAKKNDFWAGGE